MSKELLKDIIKDLDDLNKQNVVKVTVPSSGKELGFELFNVSQHKDLLKSAFEGYEGVIRSSAIFNDIIINNSESEYDFSLADRSYILTQLRKESLSSKYIVGSKEYDLNDLPEPDFDFDYSSDVEYKGINVKVKVPSLTRDTIVAKKLISEISKLNEKQRETDAVNIVLTYEIIKFVESVEVGENVFELNNFNLYESKKLIDSLPLKLNNMIVEAISEFRKQEEKNITFDDGVAVEIDASFLSSD